MPMYTIHLYREMKLRFDDVIAPSAHAAADLAYEMPTGQAAAIGECDGETFSALADLADDENYEHSQMIDYPAERLRQAAPQLLEACELLDWAYRNGQETGSVSWEALNDAWAIARAAILKAKGRAA